MRILDRFFSGRRHYKRISNSVQEHITGRDELSEEWKRSTEAAQTARREARSIAISFKRSPREWQWPTVASVLADIQFTLRQLLKSPGFSATAVITLSLGIAINATMFSMVSAFLLPHLPGRDPQHIVVVSSINPDSQFQPEANPVSAPNYIQWSSNVHLFSEMAAADEYRTGSLSDPGQQPEAVSYAAVSPNYFTVFGAVPSLGRAFLADEDQPGHDHVLILGHGLWERRFGSDPSVIGRTLRLNREDYIIVGVMPADFRLMGFTPQLWAPLQLAAADRAADARKNRFLYLFARLAPGVTLQQARAEMSVVAQRAQKDFSATEQRWGTSVRTLPEFLIYNLDFRIGLSVMMTVVGFVLLIACTNVTGLMLTRALGRRQELAIRMSLGASHTRIVRQLFTEGLVIALCSGAVGLSLSYFGIRALGAALNLNEVIGSVPIRLDTNVLIFVTMVSLVSAILCSVAPALKAWRREINTDLKSETRTTTSGHSRNRLRAALVGGEIAVALFLLIGVSLLIRGVYLLEHQKLGFRHDHLETAGVVLDQARYADSAKQLIFVREVLSSSQRIPGVLGAAVTSDLPAIGANSIVIHVKGQTQARSNQQDTANDVVVTPDYFSVVSIPLLRGRTFTASDDSGTPRVVIVNQEFVHRYLQDRNALGQQIQIDAPGMLLAWSQIVGVVGNVNTHAWLPRVDPEVYQAWSQRPTPSFSVILRSNVEPESLAPQLRQVFSQIDSELPLQGVMSMDQTIDAHKKGNRLFTKLLATFATLALILSTVGIYGLIAYSVGRRTHEIGIRLAFGAKASDISQMILREGLKVASIGATIGILLAAPLPKLFASIFQGLLSVSAPQVYAIVPVLVLLVTFVSILGPAQRAARTNPTSALRNE